MKTAMPRVLAALAFSLSVLTTVRVPADTNQLAIQSFRDGLISWSTTTPYPFYHVEWTTHLPGPWLPYRECLETNTPLTLPTASRSELFFRIVATTNSWFFNGLAASWTANTELAAIAAHTNGQTFIAMTQADANSNVVAVTGAIWNPQSVTPLVVHCGTNGFPERAVLGDHIFLFANYTSNTVDVATITPYGTNVVSRQIPLPAYASNCVLRTLNTSPSPRDDGPQPDGQPDHYTLREILEATSAGLGIAGCAIASVTTGGLALLPCGAALISLAAVALPDDATLGNTSFALDTILCVAAPANPAALGDCASALLDLGVFALTRADEQVANRVDAIAQAMAVLDQVPPTGMALIPAGSFTMGDSLDGDSSALPLHTVYVSAFYMDKYEVTKALWDEVRAWATTHSYSFVDGYGPARGNTNNHPIHSVSWFDAVAWCNARSEKEGKVPAYYTSAARTTIFRGGIVDLRNDWVKWSAGYRLPTEAEWEKAARGGAHGWRFPWTSKSTITHADANYVSFWAGPTPYEAYDLNTTSGNHPAFMNWYWITGVTSSPVGYFAPNGYGLYDMAGNMSEWCWDFYGGYPSTPQTDPRGSDRFDLRVVRGGNWYFSAEYCRLAARSVTDQAVGGYHVGFRCVLPSGQ